MREVIKVNSYNIIYTREEADAKGIKYVYWADAVPDVDRQWVLSDDDQVLEATRVKLLTKLGDDLITKQVSTVCGTYWRPMNKERKADCYKCLVIPAYDNKVYVRPYNPKRIKRFPLIVKYYTRMLMRGEKIDYRLIARLSGKNETKTGLWRIRHTMRRADVQDCIMEEMEKYLQKGKYTNPAEVVKLIDHIIDKAKDTDDLEVLVKMSDKLIKMTGLEKKQTKQTDTFHQINMVHTSGALESKIEKEEVMLRRTTDED